MTSMEFRYALKLRLGIAFKNKPYKCCCKGNNVICDNLNHLFNCKRFTSDIYKRHYAMQKCLKSMFTCVGYRTSDQNLNIFRILDTNNDQRTDLMVFNLVEGKDCTFDISVVNPSSSSCITEASTSQKSSIKKSEYVKNRKYLADCELLHVDFKPVIWEVFGMPSDYFCDLFSLLATNLESPQD